MTTATTRPGLPRKPDSETADERIYRDVSFASSEYVAWQFGRLRLGNANLDRMQTSGVPVLRSHNGDLQVGEVTSVRKEDWTGLWRSDWRLPKIEANRTTFEQLDAGLMRGISVGGKLIFSSIVVDNEDPVDDIDDLQLTADFELVEQSLTPIPADVTAGIDRAADAFIFRDGQLFDLLIGPDSIRTPESTALRTHVQSLMRQHNTAANLRRETVMTQPALENISQEAIERAISNQLERSEALKALTAVPGKVDKMAADIEAEALRNMEYRSKVDKIQFGGAAVLQLNNWNPGDRLLDLGRILRLTSVDDLGFPTVNRETTGLEESLLERLELEPAGRSTLARIPFAAIEERQRQLQLQRNTVAGGAGARPLDINIVGDAGLLLSAFSPILAAMDVRQGLSGGQKLPYWTSQGTAAGGAEASAIPLTTWTLDDEELLPVSIATAFDISSSLRAADDLSFEGLVYNSVQLVAGEELVGQVLDGAGSGSNEIAGLWGRVSASTPDQIHEYGASQTDFSRQDVLTTKNAVALAKTDGGPGAFVLSTTMWQLCESTLRGGAASDRYLLEPMMRDGMMMGSGMGQMGQMEGKMAYHFRDLSPTGITDAGLFARLDRCTVFLWGNSFVLEEVPIRARKTEYKLVVEANLGVIQPDHNLSAIRQS